MTILQALAEFYDRLDARGQAQGYLEVAKYGFKPVEIDFVVEIAPDGQLLELRSRIVPPARRGTKLMMPGAAFNPKPSAGEPEWEDLASGTRTSGRRSYVFWDKSSYVFGVAARKETGAAVEPQVDEKSQADHKAFIAAHQTLLSGTKNPDLIALLRFLGRWKPEDWSVSGFPATALDKNFAFQVKGSAKRLDQLDEAVAHARGAVSSTRPNRQCLISGDARPFAVKHPQFKGVQGAQSSGAALVSFNNDAFRSFGYEQGENAPVSEELAFKYGAALNWLLDWKNGRRFRLGETTVVFWASEKEVGEEAAKDVEDRFELELAPERDGPEADDIAAGESEDGDAAQLEEKADIDALEAHKMRAQAYDVKHIRRAPGPAALDRRTRLHALGLSPNSGRIAVRFWLEDSWGHIERNLTRHKEDISISPPPRNPDQKVYALLYETAPQGKAENIPPRLGGELARAILSGASYPRTLYAALVGRIRADKTINPARAGLCKAFINRINRDHDQEVIPVALNQESDDAVYNLGRLFAVYEYAERSVADRNATIRDKFIGAASATPRRVFPLLMRGYEHNASALAKGDDNKRGSGVKAAKAVRQILDRFGGEMPFPNALPLQDQGRFFVGYYHQMGALYAKTGKGGQPADAEGAEQ